MEVFDCARSRLTVRRFKPEPVPRPVVTRILQAARWAPSSRNQQPWHFIVIADRQTLEEIATISTTGKFLAEAPIAIAIATENADSPELDSGRALQQMEMVAWSDGLGTCFVTLDERQKQRAKALLGIPARMGLITVLPFGYRLDGIKGTIRPKRRKPLSAIAHEGRFGTPYAEGSPA